MDKKQEMLLKYNISHNLLRSFKEIEKISLLIKKMYNEMSFTLPDTKRSCKNTLVSKISKLFLVLKKDNFLSTKSFNTDMDKMLARKSHMFEKGEINRNTTILTVVKCLNKALLEKLRKKRYDKFGYQQLQVDVYFLTQLVFDMVSFEDERYIFCSLN